MLIDVREPEEFAISRIEGAQLVPMQSVPGELQRLEAIAENAELAVLCHHGVRSLNVVFWLRRKALRIASACPGESTVERRRRSPVPLY